MDGVEARDDTRGAVQVGLVQAYAIRSVGYRNFRRWPQEAVSEPWSSGSPSGLLEQGTSGPKRGWNSHQLRMRELPNVARLHRKDPFRQADKAELKVAADRIAGPKGWAAVAGWAPADVDFRLYRFATAAEAEAMQRWIAESGIEVRPALPKYNGPMLGVAGAKPS